MTCRYLGEGQDCSVFQGMPRTYNGASGEYHKRVCFENVVLGSVDDSEIKDNTFIRRENKPPFFRFHGEQINTKGEMSIVINGKL